MFSLCKTIRTLAIHTILVGQIVTAHKGSSHTHHDNQAPLQAAEVPNGYDPIPIATREYWMRRANSVLVERSPCPFMAFGTVIVNHTASFPSIEDDHNTIHDYKNDLGTEICTGINHNNSTGNPTLDGEMAAIANCSTILTDPHGEYRLSAAEAVAAYQEFSIYTNGEPCPMCASAISWAGFRKMIFAVSIDRLVELGWPQIRIGSKEVFEKSWDLRRGATRWVGGVLAEESEPWFAWQFDGEGKCPEGCVREGEEGGRCVPGEE